MFLISCQHFAMSWSKEISTTRTVQLILVTMWNIWNSTIFLPHFSAFFAHSLNGKFLFDEDEGVSISIIRCLLLAIFNLIWQSKCDTTITWAPSKTLIKYLAQLTNKECSEVSWCHYGLLRDFEESCGHCIQLLYSQFFLQTNKKLVCNKHRNAVHKRWTSYDLLWKISNKHCLFGVSLFGKIGFVLEDSRGI